MTQEHVVNADDVQELLRLSRAYAEAVQDSAGLTADRKDAEEQVLRLQDAEQDAYNAERDAARALEAFAARVGYPVPEVQGGGSNAGK
jgi:hypothetical protein